MIKFICGLILGIAAGISGCLWFVFVILVEPPLPPNSWGRFIGTLNPTWLEDGRKMKLNGDFVFVDPFSQAWVAPKDSVVDGASIPQAFWSFFSGPYEGKYRAASVVHDVACQEKKRSSSDVHRMFYYACRCEGVDETTAKAMYAAVLSHGPQWKIVIETSNRDDLPTSAGKVVDYLPAKTLTKEEFESIKAFIDNEQPTLDAVAHAVIRQEAEERPVAEKPQSGDERPVVEERRSGVEGLSSERSVPD